MSEKRRGDATETNEQYLHFVGQNGIAIYMLHLPFSSGRMKRLSDSATLTASDDLSSDAPYTLVRYAAHSAGVFPESSRADATRAGRTPVSIPHGATYT